MSSAITFSGFNNIDFSSILNSLMTQASQPLTDLKAKQDHLATQVGNFKLLATKLSAVQTAAAALSTPTSIASFSATSTNSSAVTISAGSSATAGHYDIVVQELARAQVTASASTVPDANTTIVASGGTLTIGGTDVPLSSGVTLQQLAATINSTSGISVTASVIQSSANTYRLVLTSNSAGTANAFTVQSTLTGGIGLAFTDTNGNGVSGDTPADNAVSATDASVLVNNILVTSSSNTLDSVIPGSTITLLKKDPAATVGLDVAADSTALQSSLNGFISAYNGLLTFTNDQVTAAGNGDGTSIGRDPLDG
jgi:flagellar hook-associated protein 2